MPLTQNNLYMVYTGYNQQDWTILNPKHNSCINGLMSNLCVASWEGFDILQVKVCCKLKQRLHSNEHSNGYHTTAVIATTQHTISETIKQLLSQLSSMEHQISKANYVYF